MRIRGLIIGLMVAFSAAMNAFSEGIVSGTEETASGSILFGTKQAVSNRLTCTFYDLKRDRRGHLVSYDMNTVEQTLLKLFQSGWKASMLARYYRAPVTRYASTVLIPPVDTSVVPEAFDERTTPGYGFLLWYKGKLVHEEAVTFRFCGAADDLMMVRVDGKVVFGDSFASGRTGTAAPFSDIWKSSDQRTGRYVLGNNTATVGDWITLEPNAPLDLDIIAAEKPGGVFSAMLLVEVQGGDYAKNRKGGPILPLFQCAYPSLSLQDAIFAGLVAEEAAFPEGPIFGVGDALQEQIAREEAAVPVMFDESGGSGLRIWTGDKGQVIEARFNGVVGKQVALKSASGKQLRVPLARLCAADQHFVDLIHTLKHEVAFSRSRHEMKENANPWIKIPRVRYEHDFSVTLTQKKPGEQQYDLKSEFYVITKERKGNAFILLARQTDAFSSSFGNSSPPRTFTTPRINIFDEALQGINREDSDFHYLSVITDSEGRVISHHATADWLFPNLGKLRQHPAGSYMDRACNRVRPTRPEATLH